jgi:hypothetical protein
MPCCSDKKRNQAFHLIPFLIRNFGITFSLVQPSVKTMKLAEALILRADIRKRMAQWNERARTSVTVQEGEQPTEAPAELFGEWNAMVEEFTALSVRINRANVRATLADGTTLRREGTELTRQRRDLDVQIQAANWATEMEA